MKRPILLILKAALDLACCQLKIFITGMYVYILFIMHILVLFIIFIYCLGVLAESILPKPRESVFLFR